MGGQISHPKPGGAADPREHLRGRTELTERERKLCDLVMRGLKNKQIATVMGTTEQVIKNRLRTVFDKTGQSSRLELALWWVHKIGLANRDGETA